jgi:hypothetical protein
MSAPFTRRLFVQGKGALRSKCHFPYTMLFTFGTFKEDGFSVPAYYFVL